MFNSTNTIRLHRVLRAPAEPVYRAFLDPDAMANWLPPHGVVGKVHEMDARIGGGYRIVHQLQQRHEAFHSADDTRS